MLKSFLKLMGQKMFCPISLEVLEVYHSTKNIMGLLGESFYPILFAVMAIGLKLIEISLNARWLQPLEAKHERELLYLGYAITAVGMVSNLMSYYNEHEGQHLSYVYWVGFGQVALILVCYERLVKIVTHLKIFRKWFK